MVALGTWDPEHDARWTPVGAPWAWWYTQGVQNCHWVCQWGAKMSHLRLPRPDWGASDAPDALPNLGKGDWEQDGQGGAVRCARGGFCIP